MDGSGLLGANIVHFARILRAAGLRVGTDAAVEAVRAVEAAGIGEEGDFYWTLHASLVKRREDHAVFDQAFAIFWRANALRARILAGLDMLPDSDQEEGGEMYARVAAALMPQAAGVREPGRVEVDARLAVSSREALGTKDFAQMTAGEIALARALIARLVMPDDRVPVRRLAPAARGPRIDMRRTLRAGLRGAGEVAALKRACARRVHPPVVAICDISGSMTQYSRMFLHFLQALGEARGRVTSFVFGTRLTDITRQLRARDPDEALRLVSARVADWAGGTRIGEALGEFNRRWSRRVLGQGAVVLLMTDGLERSDPDRLAFEADRLHRSCRRLVWLNPLLGYEGFEARAGGIRAMLPHVDEFRPLHSVDSMAALAAALSQRPGGAADPRRWLARGLAA